MVNLPPQVGIGILIFAGVWTLLTIPKWGLLRTYWESKPTKSVCVTNWEQQHEFGSSGEHGFPNAIGEESLVLKIKVGLFATPSATIKSVQLELKGKRLLPSNWQSCKAGNLWATPDVYFAVPKWVREAQRKVKLVAHAEGRDWYSDNIIIDFPKQQEKP